MPCHDNGYPLYYWDDFLPFVCAYNALISNKQDHSGLENMLIKYYQLLYENMTTAAVKVVRFGDTLPTGPEFWRMGVSGDFDYDPRARIETLLCEIADKFGPLPEQARPAYKFHLKRDLRRYVGTLNTLSYELENNKKKVIDLGGTPHNFNKVKKAVDDLRNSIEGGSVNAKDARKMGAELFRRHSILHKRAYAEFKKHF